ncbi:MAG: response regulator [Armatimonadetes bacterium]|nr:response regulator [Armatimonadota bacterium]
MSTIGSVFLGIAVLLGTWAAQRSLHESALQEYVALSRASSRAAAEALSRHLAGHASQLEVLATLLASIEVEESEPLLLALKLPLGEETLVAYRPAGTSSQTRVLQAPEGIETAPQELDWALMSGAENSRPSFYRPLDVAGRRTLVSLVPAVDPRGRLQGQLVAAMPIKELEEALPQFPSALLHVGELVADRPGTLETPAFQLALQQRTPCPGCIYSEVLELDAEEPDWTLWVARSDEDFYRRSDVGAARSVALGGYAAGAALLLLGVLALRDRKPTPPEAPLPESPRSEASLTDILVGKSIDGVVAFDEHGVVECSNPAANRLLSGTDEPLEGRNLFSLLPGLAERLRPDASGLHGKRIYVEPEGTERRKLELTLLVAETGSGNRLAAMIRDVTRRLEEEEQLRHLKAQAEAANRAKSQFLANMSHEIWTPMNGIIGMTRLALAEPLEPSTRDRLLAVSSSAAQLSSIVTDILDYSKMEAGVLDFSEAVLDVRETVDAAVKAVAGRAQHKGLELTYRIEPLVPELVLGDPARLGQILGNLLQNAVKFTDRGEVSLLLVRESASGQSDASTVLHFSVSDTGRGIPEEKVDSIFEPFTQADSTTTREFGGTGLGLTISKRLVEMMSGKIWVESLPGRGSTFHFTVQLPVHQGPPPQRSSRLLRELEKLRLLVVEDSPAFQDVMGEMLGQWGVDFAIAADAAAALERLDSADWDLVLVDTTLPATDGFELVREIRRRRPSPPRLVMMLASGSLSAESEKCSEVGIEERLGKPVNQSELFNVLIHHLETAAGPRASSSAGAAPTLPQLPPLRILLAEDNLVNQTLATLMLENHSHSVVVAEDGREAVRLYESGSFDLILMDVQMPTMDGLQATRAIRQLERETGRRIAILALTAHALKGDREACLEAGMDAYLTKPIDEEALLRAMEAAVPASVLELRRREERTSPPVAPAEEPAYDAAALLARLGGKQANLSRVVGVFLASYPKQLELLNRAVQEQDHGTVQVSAHTLKGMLSNLAAGAASRLALELEEAARNREITHCGELLEPLRHEVSRLHAALEASI